MCRSTAVHICIKIKINNGIRLVIIVLLLFQPNIQSERVSPADVGSRCGREDNHFIQIKGTACDTISRILSTQKIFVSSSYNLIHIFELQVGEVVTSVPTIGFNVESVEYRNISFTVWDVGGQNKLRSLWRHYYQGTSGLIFVVDSNDASRLDEARKELHSILENTDMQDSVVLVLANKQDLPNAVSAADMCDKLQLRTLKNEWFIQPCTAITSEGLFEGIDWLSRTLSNKKT